MWFKGKRRFGGLVAYGLAVATLAIGAMPGSAAATPDTKAQIPPPSVSAGQDYRPLDPVRLADTRPGRTTVDSQFSGTGLVSPANPLILTIGSRGGIPGAGVAAVALNVTVTGSTNPGYVTVYPTGEGRPTASSVNFDRYGTVANSVITKLGTADQITIYSSVPAHVLVDVSGYFTSGGIAALTPARLADTRATGVTVDNKFARTGVVSPSKPLQLLVTGRGAVPSNATAVALNVAAVTPSSEGYLTVFPTGAARPVASNVNFRTGETVSNSVVSRVGSGGSVTIYNSSRAAHIVVDVVGYFTASSSYRPLSPARFGDTRYNGTAVAGPPVSIKRTSAKVGPIGTQVSNGDRIDILLSGRGGVPLRDTSAVILNVTVTSSSTGGYVSVFPIDSEAPTASTVNFSKGRSVPNMVVAKVGREGGISIVTSAHGAHVIVDVLGYFRGISTAGSSTTWTAFDRNPVGMPVTYDRCYPIPFAINPDGAPEGWIDDIYSALSLLSSKTGIAFANWGYAVEQPSVSRNPFDFNGQLKPILIAFTTPSVIPDLGGNVVGAAGSTRFRAENAVNYLPMQYITGEAYFDRTEPLSPGFGVGGFGQVAIHELAHVVGLGHVTNTNEIMNATMINRSGYYGPGDQTGLSVLYQTQGCPGSPAIYLGLRQAGDSSTQTDLTSGGPQATSQNKRADLARFRSEAQTEVVRLFD